MSHTNTRNPSDVSRSAGIIRSVPRLKLAFVATAIVFTAASCALPERLDPVPTDETVQAQPLDLPDARFFPAAQSAEILKEGTDAVERQRKALGLAPDAPLPPAHFLALSGGGEDGAFGAGLLIGWTAAGNRPQFDLVTGISTGALIAPFAFLGPRYDAQLRELFTTISADDIYMKRDFTSVFLDDAMADTTPLWNTISRVLNEQMVADIAAEYKKGRLLFIGTTDLDAQRPCLWNIGAIAASGSPDAPNLIRKILRASSAIPGAFQPVLIDVDVGGTKFQEMHVDGGTIAQMFLYPPSVKLRDQPSRKRSAYLIRNARNDPEWENVERKTMSIAGRAISTMIKYSGQNDALRIYSTAQRDGVDFNFAYIGKDFSAAHATDFDKKYMNALFDYAYQQALHGYPWMKTPAAFVDDPE